jgi:hypothetical protein
VQWMQWVARGQESWVRRVEHLVLRIVSLGFSLASAHAIRWFFAPLDGVDQFQPVITWMIAGGFGVLGYFVSRGLAHRLMHKERIWAYAPICVVVEFVEIFCNYALAAAVIQHATWLAVVPSFQRTTLTALTYVALSIIPLVSVLLAVVDMDLERKKGIGSLGGVGTPVARPAGPQPKTGGHMPPYGLTPLTPAPGTRPAVGPGPAIAHRPQGGGAAIPLPGVRPAAAAVTQSVAPASPLTP